jgi:hypothetical protein
MASSMIMAGSNNKIVLKWSIFSYLIPDFKEKFVKNPIKTTVFSGVL